MPMETQDLLASQAAVGLHWQRLSLLQGQFEGNCQSLAQREPALAAQLLEFRPTTDWMLAIKGNEIAIADLAGGRIRERTCRLSAVAAHQALTQIYPGGQCTESLLVVGVDQGWLWEQAYSMPVSTPALPGHRPPLYFMVREVEELWIALHLHDWRELLADERVRLMAGDDVVDQFKRSMAEHCRIVPPKLALTLGAPAWPAGTDLSSVIAEARLPLEHELTQLTGQYPQIYAGLTSEAIAARFRNGEKLRVLGITSRYTTFLQYSMRDWLAGFDRLGHETRLLIEDGTHELMTALCFARACVEFRPDLIALIDHYRGEYKLLPTQIPCAMWVQDMLPNIFSQAGGAAQGPNDFCLGFGRLHLSSRYGYPVDRYMTATIGVNEKRFDRSPPTPSQLDRYRCDVSYVSHASRTAESWLTEKLERQSELGKRVLREVYDRMVAHYERGGFALSDVALRIFIEESMRQARAAISEEDVKALLVVFNQQINNAMFRHQTLEWLAELGVDLRIYGRGWEAHPTLSRFARGVADNITDLGAIYRASKINIQVTPHGAVHQRLLDGLAAGGFFLARWHPGDAVGPVYQELWDWCAQHGITSNEQLYARADAHVLEMIERINLLETSPAPRREMTVFDVMNGHRDSDFMTSGESIWREYQEIAFNDRAELERKVRHFLTNPEDRARIAGTMRQAVIDRSSYVSINRRLLSFMGNALVPQRAVAA
jgi:hypothetical protein